MRILAILALPLVLAGCLDRLVGGDGGVEPADYVSDRTYTRWVIEVDHSNGVRPDPALLDFVKARLNSVVRKESIEFRLDETIATQAGRVWTDAEVQALARERQDVQTEGSQVMTHLLFLAGQSAHDADGRRVLGIAYGHGLIALFPDSVKSSCQTLLSVLGCNTAPYFRAVLVHEFGHILGLVDHGAPMVRPHEAAECNGQPDSGHSSNRGSVMYCEVETEAVFTLFGSGGPPTDFDEDDRADLRALQ
ncbi:MAG TPA: hypothetical protein VHI93_00725 [Candidatus Thermoplasmatota archaeon]|nr:hypothetical protein [Candidatus Thermoplasmatota archaeon]